MGYLIEGYKIMGKEIADGIVKHRAGIGTVVSIGGTIVSNILSTRAGAKSARMIDQKQMELGRTLTKKEKLALCWQNHIGSTGTAIVSCVGAGYSHNEHVKDFNKVAMAYSGVKKLYDSARQATKEVLGEKKNMELQDKINQKYIEEHPEVKKQIVENRVNPNPGVMQKYFEPHIGISFYSTKDKIDNAIKAMNMEMHALPPRNKHVAGRSGKYGVRLKRFYEYVDPDIPEETYLSNAMNDDGFNKGSKDTDDDYIAVYYTAMLLNGESEACIAINWELEPSDMTYGDYCKL